MSSTTYDMKKIVEELSGRRRGRGCFVLTRDYTGQKEWAERLARQTGSYHVSLIDLFASDKELSGQFSSFAPEKLINLIEREAIKPVAIVSGMEFLKASWTGRGKFIEKLVDLVEMRTENPAILLVLQYDKTIANHRFIRFPQYTFVIEQRETYAL